MFLAFVTFLVLIMTTVFLTGLDVTTDVGVHADALNTLGNAIWVSAGLTALSYFGRLVFD
jgi:hypothetical protein